MIELTQQQRQELEKPEPTAIDPQTRETYVLVRKEVYERLRGLLSHDGDWTPDEMLQALAESGKRAGWDAPEMVAYDNYDQNRRFSSG
jgi:hypothetical protein